MRVAGRLKVYSAVIRQAKGRDEDQEPSRQEKRLGTGADK